MSQPTAEKPMTEEQWEARKRIIDENMIKLGADQEKLDTWLAANGIFKVQSEKQEPIETRSTGAQVNLTVDAYNDTIGNKYCIKGAWTWSGTLDDLCGPIDGVTLSMYYGNGYKASGTWVSNPAGIAVYDQYGNYYSSAGWVRSINAADIVYSFQDAIQGSYYVGYQGQAWGWMSSPPSQSPIYVKMDFEHTYRSGSVSNVTVSWSQGNRAPEISMTFGTQPSYWKKANQITVYSPWPTGP
jgi:hypothetical protein